MKQKFTDKPITYFHTTKERVSDMAVKEIEKEITFQEFIDYAVRTKRKLWKTRHIKNMEDGLKWELDVFTEHSLVIAEIELPSEDYDLEIPEWLEPYIIMEVTGMNQFSNSNLAI